MKCIADIYVKRLMLFSLMLCLLFFGIGCGKPNVTIRDVKSDYFNGKDLKNIEGLKFYKKKPYMRIVINPNSEKMVYEIKMDIVTLPDTEQEQVIQVEGNSGHAEYKAVLNDDGTLKEFGNVSEGSKPHEILQQLATLISAIPWAGTSAKINETSDKIMFFDKEINLNTVYLVELEVVQQALKTHKISKEEVIEVLKIESKK